MTYSVTRKDKLIAKEKIAKAKHFAESHEIIIDKERVSLDKLSRQLIVNPKNFAKDIQFLINSFQEWVENRGLCEVVIVLTVKNHNLSVKDANKDLKLQLKQIRELRAWQDINRQQKAYMQFIEPHKSGIPHMNIAFFLPEEHVEIFLESIQNRYQEPQVHIWSSCIPASYTEAKNRKNQKAFKKDTVPGYVVQPDKSMIPYSTKNLQQLTDDLQKYHDNTRKDISSLATWYIVNNVRIFSTSQTFASRDAYRRVSNLFTLNEFTELINENIIQVWKYKQKVHIITINNTEVLWTKKHTQMYKKDEDTRNDSTACTYNENPPTEHILIQGTLKTKIKNNGILVYEILDTSASYYDNQLVDTEILSQQNIESMKEEIISTLQKEIQDGFKKTNDNLEKKIPIKIIKDTEKLLTAHDKNYDKKYLNVKDLEKQYNISASSQRSYRGRKTDPLPYTQEKPGSKITYREIEIDEWKKRQKVK